MKEIESEHILILSEVNETSQEVLDAKQREMNSLKKNSACNWLEDMVRETKGEWK